VLSLDFITVVERCALHRDPANQDGVKEGDGSNNSGPANIYADIEHVGLGLVGTEFEGNRPAGAAGFFAELSLQSQVIYFYYHPVNFVGEVFTFFGKSVVTTDGFPDSVAQSRSWIYRKPPAL